MKKLNLGCGEDYRENYVNVDVSGEVNPDVQADIVEYLEGLEDGCVDEILAYHVLEHLPPGDLIKCFQEMERVLVSGGVIRVKVPIGTDALTDPTHRNRWTWETPEYFSRNSPQFGWETGTELVLIDREIELWMDCGFPVNLLNKVLTVPFYILGLVFGWKGLQWCPYLSGEVKAFYTK